MPEKNKSILDKDYSEDSDIEEDPDIEVEENITATVGTNEEVDDIVGQNEDDIIGKTVSNEEIEQAINDCNTYQGFVEQLNLDELERDISSIMFGFNDAVSESSKKGAQILEIPTVQDVNERENISRNEAERIFEIEKVSRNAIRNKNYLYALKSYLTWYKQKEKDPIFKNTQPTYFPINMSVLKLFCTHLKDSKNYKVKSIKNIVIWSLIPYLEFRKAQSFTEVEKIEIRLFINGFWVFNIDKVSKSLPLMNNAMEKLRKVLNVNMEHDSLLDMLIVFGRYSGLRFDTLRFIKIDDIKFSKRIVMDKYVMYIAEMFLVKDKSKVRTSRLKVYYGNLVLSQCPILPIIFYLFQHREAFMSSTLSGVLEGDFRLKDEVKNQYLFVVPNKLEQMENKRASAYMRQLCLRAKFPKNEWYTTRSLRSGVVCNYLLQSLLRNGGTPSVDDVQLITRHVGWANPESMEPYRRYITEKYSTPDSITYKNKDTWNKIIKEICKSDGAILESIDIDDIDNTKDLEAREIILQSTKIHSTPFKFQIRKEMKRLNKELRDKLVIKFDIEHNTDFQGQITEERKKGKKNKGSKWYKFRNHIIDEKKEMEGFKELKDEYINSLTAKVLRLKHKESKKKTRLEIESYRRILVWNKIVTDFLNEEEKISKEKEMILSPNTNRKISRSTYENVEYNNVLKMIRSKLRKEQMAIIIKKTKLFQEAELYYENGKKTSIEQVKQYIGDGIIEEGKSDTDESTSDISFTIEVETNSELEKSDTSTDEDKQRNEFNKRIIRERKCKKKLFFKKKKKEE